MLNLCSLEFQGRFTWWLMGGSWEDHGNIIRKSMVIRVMFMRGSWEAYERFKEGLLNDDARLV